MNKTKITIAFFLFSTLSLKIVGQSNPAFEVSKSGHGNKSIIFIPGFACSGEVWNETKTIYEKEFTCYTLTMAGFAGVKPQNTTSFRSWETSIADFITANKIIKPIIIGHSMGGGLALALASDYPDLIEKMVVVDALPCLSALMNPNFRPESKPNCLGIVNQINTVSNEQFYQMQKMAVSRLVADTSKQNLVVSWSMKSDRTTFAEMYCDFSNTDLRGEINAIKCPTLILLEPYFQNIKSAVDEQYKNLKTANFQYADKGLHFIMYDDKEWYLKQLHNFITVQ